MRAFRHKFGDVVSFAWAVAFALLLWPALLHGQSGADRSPLRGQWIGGLDDNGKRILSVSLNEDSQGLTLTVWQNSGAPYVAQLTAVTATDQAAVQLRSTAGDSLVLDRPLALDMIRGKIELGLRNIGGKVVLVRRDAGGAAEQRYESLRKDGLLGPESLVELARDAARRGETEQALRWLERGRTAKRPINDAMLFSARELDPIRANPEFRSILADPVAAHPELSQQVMPIRIDRTVRIPMRDGVRLVADIYRPDVPGRFPVILIRTPYNLGPDIPPGGVDHFAPRGYVVVIQAVRGREGSEGEFDPWVNERRDGYDSVDWASRQSWSDGNVGMMGLSYLGQAQWQAAVEAHPALKAIIPEVAGTDSMLDTPYNYGLLRLELVDWLRGMAQADRNRQGNRTPLPPVNESAITTLPLSRLDEAYAGIKMPLWQRLLERDSAAAWASSNFLADLDKARVPALNISGWWDGESNSTTINYRAMRALGRTDQWLIYGPWEHVWNQSTRFRGRDYGPTALIDFKSLAVRWFDRWLKQRQVNLDRVAKVQLFVTGANQWRSYSDWPAPEWKRTDFYLAGAGPDCRRMHGSLLARAASRCTEPDVYRYDPAVVTAAGDGVMPADTDVLQIDKAAGNMVVYESEPFTEPRTFASPGTLDLWFSASAHDVDFFAIVFDRDANGVPHALTGAAKMRMSFRNGWTKRQPLRPGKLYRGRVDLRPFVHRFGAGHRLGILIRSDWFPGFARNLGTIERIKDATRIRPADVRLQRKPPHSSKMSLFEIAEPGVPAANLPDSAEDGSAG